MIMNKEIFREYDIRGIYNTDFDLDFARLLGEAFVRFVEKKTKPCPMVVTIGHDVRISSPFIAEAVTMGLRKAGADVIDLGPITSPISYFSTFHLANVNAAIMVTGSHNPPDYNGFKISVGKTTIFGQDIQEIMHMMTAWRAQNPTRMGELTQYDIKPDYILRYQREFGNLKPIPVVLDCGNGAAGFVARRLYESVGLKPTILFEDPDGRFPNHHPDPTVEENLTALIARVRETGALIGIGFDGDADRIGVVDDQGSIILGDELMVILSRDILNKAPGSKIIGDVKCSDRLYDDIRNHGGVPIMWKTGHSLIKQKVRIEGAPFGGELSGHIFFADRNYGYDDALYAGLRLVEIISRTGRRCQELLAGLPTAFNTPEIRIDTTESKKHLLVEKLKMHFSNDHTVSVNPLDGIRVSYSDGWALARPSNTQPVLVLRFESSTAEGLGRIRREFEDVMKPFL